MTLNYFVSLETEEVPEGEEGKEEGGEELE